MAILIRCDACRKEEVRYEDGKKRGWMYLRVGNDPSRLFDPEETPKHICPECYKKLMACMFSVRVEYDKDSNCWKEEGSV